MTLVLTHTVWPGSCGDIAGSLPTNPVSQSS